MKKFLFLLWLIPSFYCFSQDTDEPVSIRFNLDSQAMGDFSSERVFIVKGSPYLNESHKMGTIINGSTKSKALLRYNAYEDKFQFLDKKNKKKFLLKAPYIKVELNDTTYHLVEFREPPRYNTKYYVPEPVKNKKGERSKTGYFKILHEGKTIFYQKTSKKIPKLQVPENGYEIFKQSEFVLVNSYFIKKPFKLANRFNLSKNEVLLALNDKYDEIRTYIKKNKLKAKTVEEVIQIISYYDSLD